jgi:hypothetical protein
VEAQEEAWLPAGDFESSPGAGEAPGAEQWVVTSYGVIRYAAAKLRIEARPTTVSLAVSDGTAFVWPAPDAKTTGPQARAPEGARVRTDTTTGPSTAEAEGWQRVAGGRVSLVPSAGSERPQPATAAAATATTRCSQLAKEAHDLAAALFAPVPDGAPSRAADQVRVRRLARAACAVAHLRAGTLDEADADAHGLLPILRQADSDWRALPTESDGGPPTE